MAKKLSVFVSIEPQAYFVQQIGGDRVQTQVMVEPGFSPATYEPSAKQMAQLTRADLYFSIGVPFEKAWLPRFKAAGTHLKMVAMDKGLKKLPMSVMGTHGVEGGREEHDAHDDHDRGHGALDPHVWLSPEYVRKMAPTISDALVAADPAGKSYYKLNCARFMKSVNALDVRIDKMLDSLGMRRTFLTYHPAFGYFAHTYNLIQVSIEQEGKEPSPRELTHLINFAKAHDIKVIVVEPQFARRSAEALARAIGGKVAVADPLAEDWPENLLDLARTFKEAVQ